MNGNILYTAVSGIDEAYLADTEDMAGIKAENVKARKRKQSLLVGVCTCLLFVLGVIGVTKLTDPQKTDPHPNHTDPPAADGQHMILPFAAKNAPDADAFGEDEIHQVYLSVQGIRYEQLNAGELAHYGISESIPDSAFGASVGTVVESFPNQETKAPVSSPEPSLAGAQVFYYGTANGSAVLIAEKGGHCSVFSVSQWPAYSSFRESCAFFGAVPSAEGIESISYTIKTLAEDNNFVTTEGILSDTDAINAVCAVLQQLTPEEPPEDERAPTPEWYADAWQRYKENPDGRVREDITLKIRFRNGCRMTEIVYQPFIGNGYVDGMKELTPEQNKNLRGLLK
ncbi:MAG: hypothetical protein IK108_09920 [Clostridia bacterium]|nr:hypothetical protein [Clostridia bacterium]